MVLQICASKMEVMEATNAHLGTKFSMGSDWQDVFKEEAALPDGGNSVVCHEEEWPSDDSEDNDDPENRIVIAIIYLGWTMMILNIVPAFSGHLRLKHFFPLEDMKIQQRNHWMILLF